MLNHIINYQNLKHELRHLKPFSTFLKDFNSTKPIARGPHPHGSPHSLLNKTYLTNGLHKIDNKFSLYRIIGNDLPPRHIEDQSFTNLKFIIRHEPELHNCKKWFVVNRIINKEKEEKIISLLEKENLNYLHIPFNSSDYSAIDYDQEGIPQDYLPGNTKHNSLSTYEKYQVLMRLYRLKNNYIMNNNGARNLALNHGKKLSKWIMPFDGNCFFTKKSWSETHECICSNTIIPYHLIPMARVTDNHFLLNDSFKPKPTAEPQIAFRCDTSLKFNEEYQYGRRPKVELFWRLGVPGKWDNWYIEPWDLPLAPYSKDAGNFAYAGWVSRLFSGNSRLEKGFLRSKLRSATRTESIISFIDSVDYSF